MARYPDVEMIEYRLSVWREGCRRGLKVADIAHQLHMTRGTLDQFVYRQRKAGHPKAVYHPDACFTDPEPSAQKLAKRLAARRRDRRRKAERAVTRAV
jgi:hypothetical protein